MNFIISIIAVLVALLVMGVLISKEFREKFNLFLGFVVILFPAFYFTWWKSLIYCIVMGIIFYYMIRFEIDKKKHEKEDKEFLRKLENKWNKKNKKNKED